MLHAAITTGALGWMVLILLAPGWSTHRAGVEPGARGTTAALVRMIGARVCHQRPARSFHLRGQSMPVCGRCTGLYVSGALGLLGVTVVGRRRLVAPTGPLPAWWPTGLDPRTRWLALASLPTAATWALDAAGVWDPGTPLRALAALPLGLAAGWLMGRSLQD